MIVISDARIAYFLLQAGHSPLAMSRAFTLGAGSPGRTGFQTMKVLQSEFGHFKPTYLNIPHILSQLRCTTTRQQLQTQQSKIQPQFALSQIFLFVWLDSQIRRSLTFQCEDSYSKATRIAEGPGRALRT